VRWSASPADRITLNRERLLLDARAHAAALANAGYIAPQPRTAIPAPGASALAALQTGAFLMGEAGYASEHEPESRPLDRLHPRRGPRHSRLLVSEQYLLDLEREAFLSLCGERKTRSASLHLKTGKPLRN